MFDSEPIPSRDPSAAAWSALGVSWCWAMTSAPASTRVCAADFSLGGSYHVRVQITLILALGFTDQPPNAKAFTPATTVVMGWAATNPMVLALVIFPATIPVRYRRGKDDQGQHHRVRRHPPHHHGGRG